MSDEGKFELELAENEKYHQEQREKAAQLRLDRLTARVKVMNGANKIANEMYVILAKKFAPLVGKKILKADGTLMAKYADLEPPANGDSQGFESVRYYRDSSRYALGWSVYVCCKFAEDERQTAERIIRVGELAGDVLKNICEPPAHPTNYTVEDVLAKRERFRIAEKEYNEAKSALFPFDEYDRR